MTAALPIPARNDWTAEDLDNLPDSYRYEIVDGARDFRPQPTRGIRQRLTDLGKYYEHSPRAGVFKVGKPWPIEIDLDAVAREAGLGER